MLWPVELGREENRRCLENLIRAAQLGVLPLQPPDLGMLLTGQTGPCPGVHLGLADPLTQRLRRPDASFSATAQIAGQSEGYPGRTSATIRTARSRSSGG